MKITPVLNLPLPSFPLPIYTTVKFADAVTLEGEKFSVFAGLDERRVAELKALSTNENDTELQKNTSDMKRFGVLPYETWYGKKRTPFVLIHDGTNSLAGLVWLGPQSLFSNENNWHTIGWRSYNPFRGKGIMKDFAQFVMNVYSKNIPDIIFWVATDKNNAGSTALASSLGFQILEEASGGISLFMIK